MLLASLYLPTGARFEALPDGCAFVCDSTTRVEVHERISPLRRARDVFDAALGIATTMPILERLTREGEPAALLGVASAERHAMLGVAYGDDWYRLVVGCTTEVTRVGEISACVRRLTLELPLGLGEERRRRFRYTPPAGWHSLSRHGLITEWFAPGFPSNPTRITVYPSSPLRETPSRAFDRSLHEMRWGGFTPSATWGPLPLAIQTFHAQELHLAGTWRDGTLAKIAIVVLHDHARAYVLRLDHDGTRAAEHLATLRALAASVIPVGRPQPGGGPSATRAPCSHVVD